MCSINISLLIVLLKSSGKSISLKTIQNGQGWKKAPSTGFSVVPSTKVEISPKKLWHFVLTLLLHWFKIARSYLLSVLNYWTWTKCTPQKLVFSGQTFMITSLTEMLELPNFGYMATSRIWFELFWSFVGYVIVRNYDIIPFILKNIYFKKV